MSFVVVYDACVLYPSTLRDLLIRIAQAGLVQARWTDRILDRVRVTDQFAQPPGCGGPACRCRRHPGARADHRDQQPRRLPRRPAGGVDHRGADTGRVRPRPDRSGPPGRLRCRPTNRRFLAESARQHQRCAEQPGEVRCRGLRRDTAHLPLTTSRTYSGMLPCAPRAAGAAASASAMRRRVSVGWITSSTTPISSARLTPPAVRDCSSMSWARSASRWSAGVAASFLRCRMFTAAAAPITAVSAVGQAYTAVAPSAREFIAMYAPP